jgi:hypothetical protein
MIIPDGIEFIRYRRFYSFLFPLPLERLWKPLFPCFSSLLIGRSIGTFGTFGIFCTFGTFGIFGTFGTCVQRHLPFFSNTQYSLVPNNIFDVVSMILKSSNQILKSVWIISITIRSSAFLVFLWNSSIFSYFPDQLTNFFKSFFSLINRCSNSYSSISVVIYI